MKKIYINPLTIEVKAFCGGKLMGDPLIMAGSGEDLEPAPGFRPAQPQVQP